MGERAEEVQQDADRGRLEHDRVLAGPELGERLAADLARGAAGDVGRVDRAGGRRRRRREAAAPVGVAADDLHERVGDLLVEPQAARRGDRGAHGAGGPHPEGLQAVLGGDAERPAQGGAGAGRVEPGGVGVEAVGAGGRRGGAGGREAGVVALARAGRRAGGDVGAAGRVAQRVVVEAVRRRERAVAVAHDEDLDCGVVDLRRLGRRRAREARHERALAHDRDLQLGAGAGQRERALGDLQWRAGCGRAHATPTCTSRKRAGAVPCETRMTWPGSPLPQLPTPHSRHAGAEQTASSPPQNVGVTPA